MAGSQIFNARIWATVGLPPQRSSQGRNASSTIGCVSDRGV